MVHPSQDKLKNTILKTHLLGQHRGLAYLSFNELLSEFQPSADHNFSNE